MADSHGIVTQNAPASTGTQNFTKTGLGTVKGYIALMTEVLVANTDVDSFGTSIGASDFTTESCQWANYEDNQATTDAKKGAFNSRVMQGNTPGVDDATEVAVDNGAVTDGIQVNYSAASATLEASTILLKEGIANFDVQHVQAPASGSQTVTCGFQADIVIAICAAVDGLNTTRNSCEMSMGFYYRPDAAYANTAMAANNGSTTPLGAQGAANDSIGGAISQVTGLEYAHLTLGSFTSTGYDITKVSGSNQFYHTLISIKLESGYSAKVGFADAPTSTGVTSLVTNLPFTPQIAMFSGVHKSTVGGDGDESSWYFGAVDADNEVCVGQYVEDSGGATQNSDAANWHRDDSCIYMKQDTGTLRLQGTLDTNGLKAGSIDINFSTVNTGSAYKIGYLAIGPDRSDVSVLQDWQGQTAGAPTGDLSIPSGPNRLLYMAYFAETGATHTYTSITVGGQAPTGSLIEENSNSAGQHIWSWYWDETAIAAMSGTTVSLTKSGTPTVHDWDYIVLQTAGGGAEFATSVEEASVINTSITTASASTANDYLINANNRSASARDIQGYDTLTEGWQFNTDYTISVADGPGGDDTTTLTGDGFEGNWLAQLLHVKAAGQSGEIFNRVLTENTVVTDPIAGYQLYQERPANSNVELLTDVAFLYYTFARLVADNFSMLDAFVIEQNLRRDLSEVTTLEDAVDIIRNRFTLISDALSVTDDFNKTITLGDTSETFFKVRKDSLVATDYVDAVFLGINNEQLADTIALGEYEFLVRFLNRSLNDQLAIVSDLFNVTVSKVKRDLLRTTDNASATALRIYPITVSDYLSLVDFMEANVQNINRKKLLDSLLIEDGQQVESGTLLQPAVEIETDIEVR